MSSSEPLPPRPGGLPELLRRPAVEAALVGFALAAIHALVRMSGALAVGSFNDDGVYAALGKSIAEGTGYRSIYTPGDPVHLKYPPGLPLVLAVLWKIGGDLNAVTGLHGVLTLAVVGLASACLWWLARHELKLAVPLAIVFVLGPFLLEGPIQYYHLVLTESYFVALWAASLVAYAILRDRSARGDPRAVTAAVVTGLLIATAILFRTQAIVLVPAILGAALVDRLRRSTISLLAGAALGPVAIWTGIHRWMVAPDSVTLQPDEAPYTSWLQVSGAGEALGLAVRSMVFNWTWYWRGFPGTLVEPWLAGVVLVAVLAILVAWGAAVGVRRQPALALTVAFTIALIALWPWPQDRFIFGFLPPAALLAGAALQRALARCARPVALGSHAALTVLALLVLARQMELRRAAYGQANPRLAIGVQPPGHVLLANTRYLIGISQWVRANTRPEDRLLVDSPAAVYLYTGRKAVNASPGERGVGPSALDVPARYVAERVINEGVSIIVPSAPQLIAGLRAIEERCPGTLAQAGTVDGWTTVNVYRVVGGRECLEEMARQGEERRRVAR